MWQNHTNIQITSMSLNHVDVIVGDHNNGEWRFTGMYGFSEEENKVKTGALMSALARAEEMPWLCGGDFNLMLVASEKRGGDGFNANEANILREAMEACKFMDMGFVGYEFTWSNNRGGDANIQERLDRFFVNDLWKAKFPNSFVSHVPKRKSDHLPLLMSIRGGQAVRGSRAKGKRFRFEAMWLMEEESSEVVKGEWNHEDDVRINLARTTNKLTTWSRQKFGNVAKELR